VRLKRGLVRLSLQAEGPEVDRLLIVAVLVSPSHVPRSKVMWAEAHRSRTRTRAGQHRYVPSAPSVPLSEAATRVWTPGRASPMPTQPSVEVGRLLFGACPEVGELDAVIVTTTRSLMPRPEPELDDVMPILSSAPCSGRVNLLTEYAAPTSSAFGHRPDELRA